MKYQPTPRDLFNPPPQAIDFGNGYNLGEIEKLIDECFPDYYHPVRRMWQNTLEILQDHEKLIGVKP